jgi:aspartate/methionine/tyrosine aminotransferase
MEFHPIVYMDWAKRFQHGRPYDLTVSGMDAPPAEWLTIPMPDPARGPYGPPDLIAGVAQRFGVSSDQVLLACGSSAANFIVPGLLCSPGDEVLIERPTYEPLIRVPAVFGATVTRFERLPEEGWALDLERVEAAVTPKTRLICVTNLHNPSGVRLTDAQLLGLAAIAEANDAWVLVDEVYLDYAGDGPQRVATALSPRLISTGSLTKVYGLGDLRVGWAIMTPDLVRTGEQFTDLMNVNLADPALAVAQQAWPQLDRLQGRARQAAAAGLPLVEQFVVEIGGSWTPPDGCPFGFVKLPDGVTGTALFEATAEDGVQATPGINFDGYDDHIRLAFMAPHAVLEVALQKLAGAISRLR